MTRAYEYRHTVAFQETNLVGNVYFTNHLSWQGRCREMFVRDHAPSVLDDLQNGLVLVTTHCSCDYLEELRPFDEVTVRMTLGAMTQSRVVLDFEYWRGVTLIARGQQKVASMRRQHGSMSPAALPVALCEALRRYGDS